MLSQPNVFLIGPMGSGKSAVGRHLARLLRFSFHDSDADIEARTGVDIAFIFEKEGEAGFRLRERESIERLTRLTGVVIATGGGAVINVDNRRMLAERGAVVYLETSIEQQAERAGRTRHRPLLQGGELAVVAGALAEHRPAVGDPPAGVQYLARGSGEPDAGPHRGGRLGLDVAGGVRDHQVAAGR